MNLKIKNLLKAHTVRIFALCLCLLLTAAVQAATVTTAADSGMGSLRQAVIDANATTADDTIDFSIPVCPNNICTITLTGGEIIIGSTPTAGKLSISNASGTFQIVISGNNTSRVFYVSPTADLTLDSVTVTNGNGTGASLTGNGGGIAVSGSSSTTTGTALTINNSTISNNSTTTASASGGGIYVNGSSGAGAKLPVITISNSTISNNTASTGTGGNGGGIYDSRASVTLNNSTVAYNTAYSTGGGIYVLSNATTSLAVRNTIIASNTVTTSQPDIFKGSAGVFTSNGYNLVGVNSTSGALTYASTDQKGVSALLAPLGYYGGLTQTVALTSLSPAIDKGSPTGTSRDQRGAARNVGNLDVGAFELNNAANGGSYAAALPNGQTNTPYSLNLTANSGTYTYSLKSGSVLPPGLSLDNSYIASGPYSISGTPTTGGTYTFTVTASDGTNSFDNDYSVFIYAPTAATAALSGRVLTAAGHGITNVRITLTDSHGSVSTAFTSTFGYYRFTNLAANETYVVSAAAKRFTFNRSSQFLNLGADVDGVNFVAR